MYFDTLINNPIFMSGAFILNMFGGRMIVSRYATIYTDIYYY